MSLQRSAPCVWRCSGVKQYQIHQTDSNNKIKLITIYWDYLMFLSEERCSLNTSYLEKLWKFFIIWMCYSGGQGWKKKIALPLDEKLTMFVVVPSSLHTVQFQNDFHGHCFENQKLWLLCYLAAWNLSDGTNLPGPDPTTPSICVQFRYKHSNWLA